MNKILLAIAGLLFLSINVYSQQRAQPTTTNTYYDNGDLKTETTIQYDSSNKITEKSVANYSYFDSKIVNKTTVTTKYGASEQEAEITTEEILYNMFDKNDTSGARINPCDYNIGEMLRKHITTSKLIAGELRETYSESEVACTKNKAIIENEYDKMTGKLTQTITKEFINAAIDNCNIVKYSEKGATESDITYLYGTDDKNLLIVTVFSNDKKATTELRSYTFSSDFSTWIFEKKTKHSLSPSEQKTEAELIKKLADIKSE